MAGFFVSWKTWQKLVFILGCGIILVVLAGLIKLAYNHVRLQKYAALAEREKQEQALHRQLSQRREAVQNKEDTVHFGIRALERDPSVEHLIWDSSRTNSRASSLLSHTPPKEMDVDLERQETMAAHERPGSESATEPTLPARSSIEHTACAIPSGGAGGQNASAREAMAKPPDSAHPPSSLSKYRGMLYHSRQSNAATNTSQAKDSFNVVPGPMARRNSDETGNNTVARKCSSTESSEGNIDSGPLLHQPRPRSKSADLGLMHRHRISQAAETGQLTPRVRKPGNGDERAMWTTGSRTATLPDSRDYFAQDRRHVPSPNITLPGPEAQPPSLVPQVNALPATIRTYSVPDVTPFTQFHQTTSAPPRPESSMSSSAGSNSPSQPQDEFSSIPSPAPSSNPSKMSLPTGLSPPLPPPESHIKPLPAQTQEKRGSFDHRTSAVIRGHGTDFEILAPGTLPAPTTASAEEGNDWRHSRPPVSLYNYNGSRARSSSAKSGRKLQKKRRQSTESRASGDTE